MSSPEQCAKWRETNSKCIKAYKANYYKKNLKNIKNKRRNRYIKNKQSVKEYNKQYKLIQVLRKLRLTLDQYNLMLLTQNNKCAICHKDFANKSPHIDHSHLTSTVRGLLCSKCNTGIGLLNEDLSILESAIDYLSKH